MLRATLIFTVIFFIIHALIKADEEYSCIKAEPLKDINWNALSGVWLGYLGIRIDKNCLQFYLYDLKDDNKLPMVKMWMNQDTAYMEIKSLPFNKTGQGTSSVGDPITLIDTDYESYAVFVACEESTNRLRVIILTRQRKNNASAVAFDALERYNIKQSELKLITRNNCPIDWSDAEKDEQDFTFEEVKKELQDNELIPN